MQAFKQQMGALGAALQTGQLPAATFGLQARGLSVADFLIAIQESVDREAEQERQAGGGDAMQQ